ncbi:MAG: hypothetical protein K2H31_09890 [Lachnospiraceae bacterium]|nr:hypothetical protein [Lachnospiraceae bacterium]
MEEKALLKRTHGGALLIHQIAFGRPEKQTIRDIVSVKDNYYSIALKAVSMIKKDVIFLISATVCFFMAQNIPDNLRIRVVTNSIVIAEELRTKDNVSVILLGGEMDNKGNCYDSIAIEIVVVEKDYGDVDSE